ncbi:allantoate amidohydrolase [Pantoea sp. Aalb]|uniref:allantoate amidohydrolase n=1 Tax=Pantoea sp. Aalb TaxID=2576762 RepID=UPI0013274F4A|nr:allantoate amidohydrolase [Pantoea sp. Aalb]MXP67599.1 allantoate amidohydrolase [Pantoea sp. Aalb]
MFMSNKEAYSSAVRTISRCNYLAKISESDTDGLTRLYLSQEHLLVNKCVGKWMQEAGMKVWQDAVGNICGRYESVKSGAPILLLGSHLDTVRNAGRYDGVLGVISAIEIIQWLQDHKQRLPLAIEVIGFGDEEGTRFGITLLGSKALTGKWSEKWIHCSDMNGITLMDAMKNFGLNIQNIDKAKRNTNDIIAYLELHIEQGPCLEQEELALGVVTAINGARRLNCYFIGESGHAGTVPMLHRKDALVAAAEWISYIEKCTKEIDSHLVATVGMLDCLPGAVNVIPGKITLKLDIRGPQDNKIEQLLSMILNQAQAIALYRSLQFNFTEYYRIDSTKCDARLTQTLIKSVESIQGRSIQLPSGAGHDAIAIAEQWPVGMLFIRNYKGISHHPKESVKIEDIALGLQAYLLAIDQVSRSLS